MYASAGCSARVDERGPHRISTERHGGGVMNGTLEDRYDIYVQAMTDLGLPYQTFDQWLNS